MASAKATATTPGNPRTDLDTAHDFDIDVIPSEHAGPDPRFDRLPLADDLPKPPFVQLVVGPIGSGKSSLVYTLLNKWYRRYFDQVLVYNGTADSNDAWRGIDQKEVHVYNDFDENEANQWARNVMQRSLIRKERGKRPHNYAIAFDDLILDGIVRRGGATELERFITKCRHFRTSVIISSQKYSYITPGPRSNATVVNFFRSNLTEAEAVARELGAMTPPPIWIQFYNKHVWGAKKPDGSPDENAFMTIFPKRDPSQRYRFKMDLPYLEPPPATKKGVLTEKPSEDISKAGADLKLGKRKREKAK